MSIKYIGDNVDNFVDNSLYTGYPNVIHSHFPIIPIIHKTENYLKNKEKTFFSTEKQHTYPQVIPKMCITFRDNEKCG